MTPDLLFEYGITIIMLFVIGVYVLAWLGFFDRDDK